jgi:lipoprotein-anchoring transpeptidase ErfK/SrfK
MLRGFLVLAVVLALSGVAGVAGANNADDATGRRVTFLNEHGLGAIVIKTKDRHLYYTLSDREAIRYDIAVGSPQNQWYGTSYVSSKREDPSWSPTPSMRRRNPALPAYMAPGPENPLGIRAIYLDWGAYRIHGTNAPGSIGQAVSNGCFRMRTPDVVDLYERVHIGAPVFVE